MRKTGRTRQSRECERDLARAAPIVVVIAAAVSLLFVQVAGPAKGGETDIAEWHVYRDASGEYEFKYPDSLKLDVLSGTRCANGQCGKLEEVSLRGLTVTDGKTVIRNMLFSIQRGINPRRLPVQQWYESLAHRPLNRSETIISIGGKFAIHRGPFLRSPSVAIINGRSVSRPEELIPDNSTFVPLDGTDMLTISASDGPSEWVKLCNRVRSGLTFAK